MSLGSRQRLELDLLRHRGARKVCATAGCTNLTARKFCHECDLQKFQERESRTATIAASTSNNPHPNGAVGGNRR